MRSAAVSGAEGVVVSDKQYLKPPQHVPQRDMVAQQQIGPLGVVLGHWLVEQRSQHTPEPVLGMPVEKRRLARFRRGHRAQHEHLRALIEHWRNTVLDVLQWLGAIFHGSLPLLLARWPRRRDTNGRLRPTA